MSDVERAGQIIELVSLDMAQLRRLHRVNRSKNKGKQDEPLMMYDPPIHDF